MAKDKENPQAEYLKLASEVVNTMKEYIQNELYMNLALNKTQENVSTYIRTKTKPKEQNIEFKSSEELEDFKRSFVNISEEKIDPTVSRLKTQLNNLSQDNIEETKKQLANIKVSINSDKEFAQNRLDLAGEVGNTMVAFMKENKAKLNKENKAKLSEAELAFLDKSNGYLNSKGKIKFFNNQDFDKFKNNLDKLAKSPDSKEINEKIKDLTSAMDCLAKGKISDAKEKLQSFQNNNPKQAAEKPQKIHKKIKRAFKSAKEKVKNIGNSISNKVSELKEIAKEKGGKLKEKGSEWKGRVKNKISTWRK